MSIRSYLALLFIWLGFSASAQAVLIADQGKALVPIVLHADASPELRATAEEMAGYLQQITGAKFSIISGDGQLGLVLGTSGQFPDSSLKSALAMNGPFDGREAFVIRSDGSRIRLIGNTDLAVSHAAFALLEQLGCRWFFPGDTWQVIPRQPHLEVDWNHDDRPAVLSRRIWPGYGYFDRKEKKCQNDFESWSRHNRMAASLKINAGHAWQNIIVQNKREFDAHPEYLALVNGKRIKPQLCVSNPAVRKMAVESALKYLRANPQAEMASMECSDGEGHCQCENCVKLGSVSNYVFGLANEVAKAVAVEFPGKWVGCLAYASHSEPPDFALAPNVYVELTNGFTRGKYSFTELKELWPKVCANIGFYDYLSVWPWDFDMVPGGRAANASYLRKQFPDYIQHGARSITCEAGNNWGPHGRGYYLANRLMWNPKTDIDGLLSDFYDKAFGPAAAVMRRYYDRLDPGNEPLKCEDLLARALRDLEEAGRLTTDRPDIQARLDHLRQYQHYVRLRWDYDRTTDKPQKKAAALTALQWGYRTRYSYMNHWEAMYSGWIKEAITKFDAADWADHASNTPPWKIATPVTAEETQRVFADDLSRFAKKDVTEIIFSTNLVPAGFPAVSASPATIRFQSTGRYALFRPRGDPLEFTISTGLIAHYRDRRDAEWTITDSEGRKISSGRLPLDGNEHPIKVPVTAAGSYWLEFEDSGTGWGFKSQASTFACWALAKGRGVNGLGQLPVLYFYVPKGTRQLQYYWLGSPHDIHSPDGKRIQTTTVNGDFATIEIPAGADGQVWSIRKISPSRLWFFNAPNYLATDPAMLLIPLEVAQRDGRLSITR